MAKFPLHSDSFFTENSVKAPDVNFVVDKYKKNVVEHIEAHLKLMLKSEEAKDIDFQKIVDVTVDGEYKLVLDGDCLLYTSPSPRDRTRSRMPSSA